MATKLPDQSHAWTPGDAVWAFQLSLVGRGLDDTSNSSWVARCVGWTTGVEPPCQVGWRKIFFWGWNYGKSLNRKKWGAKILKTENLGFRGFKGYRDLWWMSPLGDFRTSLHHPLVGLKWWIPAPFLVDVFSWFLHGTLQGLWQVMGIRISNWPKIHQWWRTLLEHDRWNWTPTWFLLMIFWFRFTHRAIESKRIILLMRFWFPKFQYGL